MGGNHLAYSWTSKGEAQGGPSASTLCTTARTQRGQKPGWGVWRGYFLNSRPARKSPEGDKNEAGTQRTGSR
eukprot:5720629-Pyramimonas_sp.AAC.1